MLTAFQLAAFFWVKFSDFAERKFKMAKNMFFFFGFLVVTFLQFFLEILADFSTRI
jgi:hypothetical protein